MFEIPNLVYIETAIRNTYNQKVDRILLLLYHFTQWDDSEIYDYNLISLVYQLSSNFLP